MEFDWTMLIDYSVLSAFFLAELWLYFRLKEFYNEMKDRRRRQ